ncbi:23S rRNA (guanosine(2251)-2'-O)-methyltransferase RlmB [Micrococcoides hystricis]|uniref:23S rRNA (Guanosine(2251)-2'-O)-methyltransferase RlmB n=1 Tax=Micrococcoides hystricis TaxID=1572761 RepID=A0ABV6PD71_9MICC
MAKPHHSPGAVRKTKRGKTVGSGGKGKRALAGKGPTPKAEDRVYHKAYKAKQLAERSAAKRTRRNVKNTDDLVSGRNSVLEALESQIPAKHLYVATGLDMDDRVRKILRLAAENSVPVVEASKPQLDKNTNDAVHQGVVLQIHPYEYPDAVELVEKSVNDYRRGYTKHKPLFVALDGITDPRNLGAIIRAASAFNAAGVIIPERRSVGMTASAWKTSAGAATRVPVAKAKNLTQALKSIKDAGVYVLGLDGGGDVELPGLELATEPLCIVVGAEGRGLSRLVGETCDQIVSIPISSELESLNASMAVGITLYEIASLRSNWRAS